MRLLGINQKIGDALYPLSYRVETKRAKAHSGYLKNSVSVQGNRKIP